MGYERTDHRQGYPRDHERPERTSRHADYDDPRDRGFFDRAGDEVRSWFGDEEAERRRRVDERYDERYEGNPRGRYEGGRYAGGSYASASAYPRSGGADTWSGGYRSYGYGDERPSDIRRVGADYGDIRSPGTGLSRGQSSWREDEYRAVYGRRDQNDDQHGYRSWRDRQISSLDRDYDEYRRENQSRFESEFSTWRQNRQIQREALRRVEVHQEVLGSDGEHVGTVDHIRGDRILLTKSDRDAGGHHHSIPSSWIHSVDDKVHLARTAEQAQQAWRDEERQGGLFDRDRDDANEEGVSLSRSFSGTY